MKHLSQYNHYIPVEQGFLWFNALSGAYILMKPSLHEKIRNEHLDSLEHTLPKIHQQLDQFGFVVEDSLDEQLLARNMLRDWRVSTHRFKMIVNPTLDCNLACWYCYEQHNPHCIMSDKVAKAIVRHWDVHYQESPFKLFNLSFFGGEPLLESRRVLELVEDAKCFVAKRDIHLSLEFTTNGTLVTQTLLDKLADTKIDFQITLDGTQMRHDSVRHYKNSKTGSYRKILSCMEQICAALPHAKICTRINVSQETLDGLDSLLNDLDTLPRDKVFLSIHKVWQSEPFTQDERALLENFVLSAKKMGFRAEWEPLSGGCCYADMLSSLVVNYNGDVYKCTARDFKHESREGILQEDGRVLWDTDKLHARAHVRLPKTCLECALLPACGGTCSQNLLESKGKVACRYENEEEKNQAILRNCQFAQP